MGTGKSALGKKVAVKLGLNFLDSDAEIEKSEGKSISDIFAQKGEAYFRQLEKKFIEMDANPDKVAKELGTTKSLLNGYFAKHEQVSFREWRTRLRIKEAERILREEDVVLPALHELVGVSDKSNFYKHFKQLTGMTPTEYRKQHYR